MDVDLFIKRMPQAIKDLISREAANNRRSVNQEAIALLEEALLQRVGSPDHRRLSARAILEGLATTAPAAETRVADAGETGPGELRPGAAVLGEPYGPLTAAPPGAGAEPGGPRKLAH